MHLTDGGLETTLLFHQGVDLPHFAAFPLLDDAAGRDALRTYFAPYLAEAGRLGLPFVIDTPTWRANPDWGAQLGYDAAAVADVNRRAVAFVRELGPGAVVNGVVGPRGDGYVVGEAMSAQDAEAYHALQIGALAEAGADRVTAVTMTYADEAIGIVRAAQAAGVPVVVLVTVETDGRLPDGAPLSAALQRIDDETGGAALGFGVNCAHPDHIAPALDGAPVLDRVVALRVNASRLSHAELDEAEVLDEGDPEAIGGEVASLRPALPNVELLGGCCGTDHRHVARIAAAWT